MRSPRSKPIAAKPSWRIPWRDVLDALALGAWSIMLMRYWFGGKLMLLLHPDYAWLSNLAAIVLLGLVALTVFRIIKQMSSSPQQTSDRLANGSNMGHVTLMPPSLSSALLLGVAVFGMIYTPQAFASQTAVQRGVSDTLTLTRSQPQRFVRAAAPKDRTIIDWIRLINVYPEPDAYAGEAVAVEGFVIYPEGWPTDYVMVSRFVLTCCAADAYPVGLPVKLTGSSRAAYPVDSWLKVSGEMTSETFQERRQVVISPTNIEKIATLIILTSTKFFGVLATTSHY